MQLYTINATPVRNFEQLTTKQKLSIVNGEDTLESINSKEVESYPQTVARILSNFGMDGFTIYKVDGYWKGESEVSFKIELAMDDATTVKLYHIAGTLRDLYSQDSVMVTLPNNTVDFI